ncbi:MAG TPA: hypothetical protein VFL57_02270 [Bryobacteraceae bacterium]|nr:hypothetical protein [Bryobacteraceae bacterium]
MVFCPNCGAAVEGRFCGKCGTAVAPAGTAAGPAGPSVTPGAQAPSGTQPPYTPAQQPYTAGQQPPPGAQAYAPPASAGLSENVASALCYLLGLITGILFLILAPYNQNKNIRFHAFQAIFFHVAWIVLVIVETIIAAALPWSLYFIASLLYMIVILGGLALWLYLMITAYQGKRVKLPVIGDLAQQQA